MDQPDLFDAADARSLLNQLIEDSRLYRTSQDYKDLLDFVVRLRNLAPFNALLLQVQKTGMGFAASARDWRDRFGRCIAEGARPLLILWPFGPVGLVYDVADTVGPPLPEDVFPFNADGSVGKAQIDGIRGQVRTRAAAAAALEAEAVEQRRAVIEAKAIADAQARRLTLNQLFEQWQRSELAPRLLADGTRIGRKDGGQWVRLSFDRRIFPRLGNMAVAEVKRADLLAILDEVKAEGKLRTATVLYADLRQMLRFAVEREVIPDKPR